MLQQPAFAWPGSDEDLVRLVAAHPWTTLVSATGNGLVVSHVPVVPDPGHGPVVVGHLPRTDAAEHELGIAPAVLVVQGPHGYVSAGWYFGGDHVSTWNFVVVHLHGVAELLDADGTLDVLRRTQRHFESRRAEPFDLAPVDDYVHRLARHVVGFRLSPTRVDAKAKLSQDKSAENVAAVVAALHDPAEPFRSPALADAMRCRGIPR